MNAILNFLTLWVLSTVLWFAIWRGVRSVLVAEFRADLFDARRRLFLVMARERIAANNPAYARLRGAINGILNRAEDVTLFTVVLLVAQASLESARVVRGTEAAILQLADPGLKKELVDIHRAVGIAIRRHIRRLAPLSPIYWIAWPIIKVRGAGKYLVSVVEAPATPMLIEMPT